MTSLESKNDPEKGKMSREDFEKLVMEALEGLPQEFKDRLDNVDVVIEDEPGKEQAVLLKDSGKCMVLGLYQGVPLVKRHHQYGMTMPDKISIFRKNIERACRNEDEIKRMVTHTVRHEIAHHLGISDERLRELGIY